jgi:glycosyltransferase involved in cell wall biosynthesis
MTRRALRLAVVGVRGMPSARGYGGIERACEGLYSRLAARGHEITVFCRSGVPVPPTYRGMRLRALPAVRTRSLETLSHAAVSVAVALAGSRFDLVHLHALAPGLFAPACRARGIPSVVTVHGLDWQRARWRGLGSRVLRLAERTIARSADGIVVLTQDLAAHFQRVYGRATTVIPNGVEPVPPADPRDLDALAAFGLTACRYALYVGRLVPEKRIQDLIAAFEDVPGPHRLAIVGECSYDDGYARGLRARAAADPRIVFTGAQQGSMLGTLFRGAAALVLPSELEGLPMVLLEALQYGLPAVASDIPPHRELLGRIEGYDLFFPVGDHRAITDRLARVVGDPLGYARVAERGRAMVLAEYDWEAVADRTEALYERVLAEAGRSRAARLAVAE